jgi:agmatine deiminase
MRWIMPPETAPQERIWMAFPREGFSLGESAAEREAGYTAWTAVANLTAEFEPVTMVVDPSETARARQMLSASIEIVERVIDDYWMRDSGPTFVHAEDGSLAAVDWIFNGWGGNIWTSAVHDRRGLARPSSPRSPACPSSPRCWSTKAAACMSTAKARSC